MNVSNVYQICVDILFKGLPIRSKKMPILKKNYITSTSSTLIYNHSILLSFLVYSIRFINYQTLFYIHMDILHWLKKKYPVFQYFNVQEEVGEEELGVLADGDLEQKVKTPQGKKIMKKVRQFASYAESKLKNGRKLYKFLTQQQGILTQIIMNNQKLKALDALENKNFEYLTELQLSNNEISHLQPLCNFSAPSLEEVDLSSNAISFVIPLNFCHWERMTSLLLSQNRIVSIEGVRLGNFTSLKVINLSDNFLTRIKYLRREFNVNLRSLDLSGNFIVDMHFLSECRFVQLASLDLRNNNSGSVFAIEKVCMAEGKGKQYTARYEIKISTEWARDKLFIYNYRDKSRHKLSVKMEPTRERLKRETLQKGRKLIFD